LPDAYIEKMVPYHLSNIGNISSPKGDEIALLQYLKQKEQKQKPQEQKPQLAQQLLDALEPAYLNHRVEKLAAELARLLPDAYIKKMMPYHIELYNRHHGRADGMCLVDFAHEQPDLISTITKSLNKRAQEVFATLVRELKQQNYRPAAADRSKAEGRPQP